MSRSNEEKSSFIAEARREQVIEATIQTLDEMGYVHASLSQIAKKAGISTALISYHFSDKSELMNHVLSKLISSSESYILERVRQENTPKGKLTAFIAASLAYQSLHPKRTTALLEIIFHARTPDNIPYYKLGDEDEDVLVRELQQILRDGQDKDEFGLFDPAVMASMIQGAIGEYMGNTPITRQVDLETYSGELVNIVCKAVKE
ncbi:TetR/AcrR family transcriptional regulator [Paenibacillus mendelii]|uniref:TetR/AcrR family transcriptional regulator n=1 Tax=Paenibacillus mendelii TaxID=206163 RepID=A0ABV6JJ02_9BACL|nr:TetR/AcrR family transcriptional regulator [Paenibacillus mendelii]